MENETQKYKFHLNHFLLFSKGWYACSDGKKDLLTTCKRVLKLDGYPYVATMSEVTIIVMNEFSSWNDWRREHNMPYLTLFDFYNEVRNYGMLYYEIKDEDEVIVRFVMSSLACIQGELLTLTKPVYSRKLYKQDGLMFNVMIGKVKFGMTYKEQNKISSEMFDNK